MCAEDATISVDYIDGGRWDEDKRACGNEACLHRRVTMSKNAARDWRDSPTDKVLVCKLEDLSLISRALV